MAMGGIDFSQVPLHALNITSRRKLAKYLDPTDILQTNEGLSRDWRGLAEALDFEYIEIKNLERSKSPTLDILDICHGKKHFTISNLIELLRLMERYDIIQETLNNFEKDAEAYIRRMEQRRSEVFPIQDPEVTSNPNANMQIKDDPILTVDDVDSVADTGELAMYDAYICFSKDDQNFVNQLLECLESPQVNFKIYMEKRDLLAGIDQNKARTQLIKERCRRLLVILTPSFLQSRECIFLTYFTKGLEIDGEEEQKKKILPLLVKPCEIPLILRYVTPIDFTTPSTYRWMWKKLVYSIIDNSSKLIPIQKKNLLPQLEKGNTEEILQITFPPTKSTAIKCLSASSNSELMIPVKETTPPAMRSIAFKQKWYQNSEQQFNSRKTIDKPSNSLDSNETSGFRSMSPSEFMRMKDTRDDFDNSSV